MRGCQYRPEQSPHERWPLSMAVHGEQSRAWIAESGSLVSGLLLLAMHRQPAEMCNPTTGAALCVCSHCIAPGACSHAALFMSHGDRVCCLVSMVSLNVLLVGQAFLG